MQPKSEPIPWKKILERLGVGGENSDGEPLVRIGLPPVENPPLEQRYANQERWDWWRNGENKK